jgi:hypothetical protein
MKKYLLIILFIGFLSNFLSAQSQWFRTGGPAGGPVFSVLEKSSSKIFLGTYSGVYKSVNSGSLFSPIALYDNQVIQITALNNRLFSVDGNYLLFRSTDDGSSWKDITTTQMSSLFVYNGILFGISPFNGMYKSTDYANTWTLLNGLPAGSDYAMASFGNYLYVYRSYVSNVIYRSSDNGDSWSVLNSDLPAFDGVNSFGSFNNYLFVNLVTSAGSMVFKSTNSGVNWTKINNWDPLNYVNSFVQSGSYLMASVNEKGIYRSSDKGENWSLANNGLSRLNAIILTKGTNKIYASINEYFTSGALFQSTNNGTTWSELNKGLTTGNVISMVLMNNNILAATSNGMYKSTNQGTNWSILNAAGVMGSSVSVLSRKDNTSIVYAGTRDSGVYVSTNFGTNWKHTNLKTENVYSISTAGANVYVGTAFNGVYVSSDVGNSWTQTSLTSLRISALASKGKYVYAGWRNTHGKPHGGIYVSSDKGLNWTACNIQDAPVSSIGIFDNDNVIISSDSVYISKNYGLNWSAVNSGSIIGTPANLVVMGYGDVYVANSNGVAGSYNYGKTWELVSYGLLSTNCRVITGNENLLLVSPPFFGVWKLPLVKNKTLMNYANINFKSPSLEYSLLQNYPNPFNPVTKINFSIPDNYSGNVSLKVYDVSGKEVSSYVYHSSKSNNGVFEVTWDGSANPSGVYFYKLIAGSYTNIKKMILIK